MMTTVFQDRGMKKLITEVEKQLGYVSIFAIATKKVSGDPDRNWREVSLGYSVNPGQALQKGQRWNPRKFEIITLMWAIDKAQAMKVYNNLTEGLKGSQIDLSENEINGFVGPWYASPLPQDLGEASFYMEFSFKDAAAEVGVNLLNETEYDQLIFDRVQKKVERV